MGERKKMLKRSPLIVLLLIALAVSVIGATAYIYQQASQTASQNIVEVANINLKSSALGNLKEGQTKFYTKDNVTELGDAIAVDTTEAHVYLHLDSNLDALTVYTTYNIAVKYSTVPGGSSHSVGDIACTLSLTSPDYSSIDLDVTGTWKFNLEITTTAGSVSSNTATSVTIVVSAEST